MAVLTRAQKKQVASPWVREEKPKDLTVTEILAAVQATEDWIQANQASFVAALPQPVQGKPNAAATVKLFVSTAMNRARLR